MCVTLHVPASDFFLVSNSRRLKRPISWWKQWRSQSGFEHHRISVLKWLRFQMIRWRWNQMVKDHFLREIPQGEVIEFIQRITPLCLTRLVCDNLLQERTQDTFWSTEGRSGRRFFVSICRTGLGSAFSIATNVATWQPGKRAGNGKEAIAYVGC